MPWISEKTKAASIAWHKSARLLRIEKYEENPSRCANCDAPLSYGKRGNKFCSRSCAASFNTKGRRHSKQTRSRITSSLKGNPSPFKGKSGGNKGYCVIYVTECQECGALFVTAYAKGNPGRKTCSKDCEIHAKVLNRTYQNGSRKPTWYFNKWQQEDVMLESSWEVRVAEELDTLNIRWERPAHIKWVDNTGKLRRYFPDFYLPDHNVHLDPKNPACMAGDREKIAAVSQKVRLECGALGEILSFVRSL